MESNSKISVKTDCLEYLSCGRYSETISYYILISKNAMTAVQQNECLVFFQKYTLTDG